MAEIVKGANGGFSGKAGSVVGGNWRDINYIRGIARRSNKPATEGQTAQRLKFALLTDFLAPLKVILETSFSGQDTSRMTPYNLALSINLNEVVTGVHPNYAIDFSKVKISKGSLPNPYQVIARAEPGKVIVSWPALDNGAAVDGDDTATIVLYNTDKKVHMISTGAVKRSELKAEVKTPDDFGGDNVVGWIFFTGKKRINSSSYALNAVTAL